jgi:predicted AAA+ superfamily ATPase
LTYELFGLSANEIGIGFDLERILNHGCLPPHHQDAHPDRLLNTYVANYLKEEIAAEGLVRRLPAFSGFLNAAALSDCEVVNHTTIARETGVSGQTIRGYFDILVDTLLGRFLPSYRLRPKRRTVASPKFYFADVGVVNFLARRGWMAAGSELFGKAFENWIFHELCACSGYRDLFAQFSYWRLPSGIEVDFIVNHMDCAIEAKSTASVTERHLKGLRELVVDHPEVKRRVVVSLDEKDRMSGDGIEILHYATFLDRLWSGDLFSGDAAASATP